MAHLTCAGKKTIFIDGLDQHGRLAEVFGWLALPVVPAMGLILLLHPVTLNRLARWENGIG